MLPKILVIHNNLLLSGDVLQKYQQYFDEPHIVTSLDAALHKITLYDYSLIINEVSTSFLPENAPLSILRNSTATPILALVRKRSVRLLRQCLQIANDCVWEPFFSDEIIARATALIWRGPLDDEQSNSHKPIHIAGLMIIRKYMKVYVNGNLVPLTPLEYNILEYMACNVEQVLSNNQIYDSAWKYNEYINANKNVNFHISNIRRKLAKFTERRYIETVRGLGYRLSEIMADKGRTNSIYDL